MSATTWRTCGGVWGTGGRTARQLKQPLRADCPPPAGHMNHPQALELFHLLQTVSSPLQLTGVRPQSHASKPRRFD